MEDHIQIGAVAPRIQYTADGAQTVFTYPFPVFADADLDVYEDDTLKTPATDYTVSGAGNSAGGAVTFVAAPAAAVVVTLRRNIAIARTSDFQEGGDLRAKTLNDGLDYLTAAIQQVESEGARALKLAATDPAAEITLPGKAARASRYLAFDADGAPIAAVDAGAYPASAFGAGLIDDADAASARATLGLGALATKSAIGQADVGYWITADTTLTVGSTGAYASVGAAYASLTNKRIADGVTVAIEIQDETVTEAAALTCDHPDGDKILITGKSASSTAGVVHFNVTGVAGAYAHEITVTDESIFMVGGYAAIYSTGATAGHGHRVSNGVWKVTAVDAVNSRITVTNTARKLGSLANLNSGTAVALNSVIKTPAGATGFTMDDAASRVRLADLVIEADAATPGEFGLYAAKGAAVNIEGTAVGVSGFQNNVTTASGGTVRAYFPLYSSAATNNAYYLLDGGQFQGAGCYAAGCGSSGVYCSRGSHFHCDGFHSNGNGGGAYCTDTSTVVMASAKVTNNLSNGFDAQRGGEVFANGATSDENDGHGVYAADDSSIVCQSASLQDNAGWGTQSLFGSRVGVNNGTVSGNTSGAAYAVVHSFINLGGAVVTGTVSPALNTEGNEVSYINT